jgi:hypothetical protein
MRVAKKSVKEALNLQDLLRLTIFIYIRRTRSKVWRIQGIYAISSKFGKFPINIRVVVAREAYKERRSCLPAACLVNTGPYRAPRYILCTFDRVLRNISIYYFGVIQTPRAEIYIFTTRTPYKISSRMLVLASLRTGIFTVECACPEPFRLWGLGRSNSRYKKIRNLR